MDTNLVISHNKINDRILEAFLCKWLTALRLLPELRCHASMVFAIITNNLFSTLGRDGDASLIAGLDPFFVMPVDEMIT